MDCTSMDHLYPLGATSGTPCFCGERRWNQDGLTYAGPTAPAKASGRLPRRGTAVRLASGIRAVVEAVDREAAMFRTADGWHEAHEVVR